MNELQSILETRRSAAGALPGAVLASVVHVRGSAYRRPGARMLILPDGRRIGTISGGCLEGDVARKARWWLSQASPAVRTYDTSSEGAAWEFGLGCNGVITVLLEAADDPRVDQMLEFIDRQLMARRGAVVATVIRAAASASCRPGDRLWCDATGTMGGTLHDTTWARALSPHIEATRREQDRRWVSVDDTQVFVEWIGPTQRLVILGAGHDVIPLVEIATVIGWDVTVADPRPGYADRNRFPGAGQVLTIPASGDIQALNLDATTAVVMMTHNYPLDLVLLPQVLARSPRYLGLLGPKSRAGKLFAESGQDAGRPGIHAPVGLDVGSDHPETIALSIAAEIQAFLSGRKGGSLRFRDDSIHGPQAESRHRPAAISRADEHTVLTACEVSGPLTYV